METGEKNQFYIRFKELPSGTANKAAAELRGLIRSAAADQDVLKDLSIEITKDSEETQDLGSALELILASSSALAVAKGIQAYIAKWGNQVTIETTGGKVVAVGDGASNIDIAKTVEALQTHSN